MVRFRSPYGAVLLKAIKRASTASASATGVIMYRSGLDREMAFMGTPRARYPKTTHMATEENPDPNSSLRPLRLRATKAMKP